MEHFATMLPEKQNQTRRSSELQGKGLHKRRCKDSTDKSMIYDDGSVFCEVVKKAGLVLNQTSSGQMLDVEQNTFQRNVALSLRKHANYPQVLDEFIDGIEHYIADPKRFYQSLMPVAKDGCESARYEGQECLLRLLLVIEEIQLKLLNLLLEKFPEFIDDEDSIFEAGNKVNLPRLLLNQFRWLNIVDGEKLATKLLEIVHITPLEVQREIILAIPEIVEDPQHEKVARSLRDLFMQSDGLSLPILDALTNLNLQRDLMTEIRCSVLQTLQSVKIENLPTIMKFLLQSVKKQDALEVISEIRANLNFSTFAPIVSSTPFNEPGTSKSNSRWHQDSTADMDSEVLTFNTIKLSVQCDKNLTCAWIRAIDQVKEAAEHKIIDIQILFILHSVNNTKMVESLFRNKIRTGCFTEMLLQSAFKNHEVVLQKYFRSILSLAEVLLRSPEPAINLFACSMYKLAFLSFDGYCKQEIVANLVIHIGSGSLGEVDASLEILGNLVQINVELIAPFAIFIKGILDYTEKLNMMQIRKFYSILSSLVFHNTQDGRHIQDDLHIVIKKQLSSNMPFYKQMGVIGAIMVVKSIATCSEGNTADNLTDSQYQQVVGLLELVHYSSSNMEESALLFLDELSCLVSKGHLYPKIVAWINDNVTSDFQDYYVIDFKENPDKNSLIPLSFLFNLDEYDGDNVAVNLLPLVIHDFTKQKQEKKASSSERIASPILLAPFFQLLSMCELQQQNGSLEGIEALLGCPLYVMAEEVLEKVDSLSRQEREIVCSTLFYTTNWFREVINAFVTQDEPEMKGKVIIRLKNITELHKILEKCLAVTPGFIPPSITFDGEEKSSAPGTKKGSKPKRKRDGTEVSASTASGDDASRDSSTQLLQDTAQEFQLDAKDINDEAAVNLQDYSKYFRELDMEVFSILSVGLITKKALDTEMNTGVLTELKLQPFQIEFLLEDLSNKLSHCLPASVFKRRTFFLKLKGDKNAGYFRLNQHSPSEIAERTVGLLPALCGHLEEASAFFQTLIAENDGVIDGPSSNSPETKLMASCFELLVKTLLTLFSWNGFTVNVNKPLLKRALLVLAKRIKHTEQSQTLSQDDLKHTIKYIRNFSDTVPNISTAVKLLKLLIALTEKGDPSSLNPLIASLSEEFLKRKWICSDGQYDKGARFNENLQVIIKSFFVYSEDTLSAIERISNKGISELLETGTNDRSDTYPTLSKLSFLVYYRVMFGELNAVIKQISIVKHGDSKEVKLKKFTEWNIAVRVLCLLIKLLKVFEGRTNMRTAIKYGRKFIEIFMRQCMPLLDQMFRSHREDVQTLLKTLQLSTRSLHHVCGHSKIIKDVSLTNQVPYLKKVLEAFVLRVKAMLSMNGCQEAFWVGNLKNRDLQGEEIHSQNSILNDTDEEEALPEDEDEESDMEIENPNEAADDQLRKDSLSDSETAASEIY